MGCKCETNVDIMCALVVHPVWLSPQHLHSVWCFRHKHHVCGIALIRRSTSNHIKTSFVLRLFVCRWEHKEHHKPLTCHANICLYMRKNTLQNTTFSASVSKFISCFFVQVWPDSGTVGFWEVLWKFEGLVVIQVTLWF